MRQLFRTQYKLRTNPIILNYQNNFHQYSFLQNDFQKINTNRLISSKEVENFTGIIQKYQNNLLDAQSFDFKEDDLKALQNQTLPQNTHQKSFNQKDKWIKNQDILSQIRNSYNQMQSNLYDLVSKQNLKDTILTMTQLNCVNLKTWQRIVLFISSYYKSSKLEQRSIMIGALSEYLKKFQFAYNINKKPAFKFMYPESYIIDLIDFREFFKSIQNQDDFIKQNDNELDVIKKLQLLQNQIYLIMKATKKADMNIYSVRQFFQKRTEEMVRITSQHKKSILHERLLYNIYFIYSYLNYTNPKFYEQIEKPYFQYLRKVMRQKKSEKYQAFQVSNKSKQINKLLSIWKLNQRPNLEIYHELIKPFLRHIIEQGLQQTYYSNIGINLLTAGIKDHQIISQMVQKWDKLKMKDDEFMHMLKHYLNIVNKNAAYQTNFHKCESFQNPIILKYLSDNHKERYSSCLNSSGQLERKAGYHKSSQHHRTQRIWSDIIKQVFEPTCQVIQNANMCNYQIDFLVLAKTGMYAIQVQGGHYNKKQFNQGIDSKKNHQPKSTGKRQMREIILKAYGISFIRIHCEQKMPTYIMQSRNVQLGKKYIIEKVQEQTSYQIQNL